MFTKRFELVPKIWSQLLVSHRNRQFTSSSVSRRKEVWDLLSAVCLERRPSLTTPATDMEIQIQKLFQDTEYERSCKSDYEIRKENERKQAELLKRGELDIDIDIASQQTVQDLQDLYQEEFSKFQCAERTTEDDEKKDVMSLNRALDKYLILVVNQKIGKTDKWVLPQGLRENGETMRQAAERVLVERCGANLQAQFLGNAPCGFYKYKYPASVQKESASDSVGAKVFFFKAWHLAGQVEVSKHKWMCLEDLGDLQSEYYHSISQFLIMKESI